MSWPPTGFEGAVRGLNHTHVDSDQVSYATSHPTQVICFDLDQYLKHCKYSDHEDTCLRKLVNDIDLLAACVWCVARSVNCSKIFLQSSLIQCMEKSWAAPDSKD